MTYTFKVGVGKSHEDPEDVESQIFVTRVGYLEDCLIRYYITHHWYVSCPLLHNCFIPIL